MAARKAEFAAPDLVTQYRAGHERAVVATRPRLGRLAIGGADALDLLHRLSTNQVSTLRPGEGTATVLTTAKGRIVDLVILYRLADRLIALCGDDRARPVIDWIERYTFREEVTVDDLTASHGTLAIFGPQSAQQVDRVCGARSSGRTLHHPIEATIGEARAIVARTFPRGGDGYLITAEAGAIDAILARLLEADHGVVLAGEPCIEVMRIEAGLPAAGRELTESYNPWEARLQDAISLDKGCYVGQEVIARLNTYDKVSKQLVRLRCADGPAPGPGAKLLVGETASGTLTSVAMVPGEAHAVALGYVRDEDATAGTEVMAQVEPAPIRATIEGVAR